MEGESTREGRKNVSPVELAWSMPCGMGRHLHNYALTIVSTALAISAQAQGLLSHNSGGGGTGP
eukprot:1349414-Rhodomonas_salina.3